MSEPSKTPRKPKSRSRETKNGGTQSPSGGLSKSERTMMAKARQACGPFAGSNPFKAAV